MRALLICIFLFNLPSIAMASSCEDSEVYSEALLKSAITHLLDSYSANAVKQPVEKCSAGPGALWSLTLAPHEEDEHFRYYRVVRCTPQADKSASGAMQCSSQEGRRFKYNGQHIDASADGEIAEFERVLDCFSEALRGGKVKISKYNSLLDSKLSIPLGVKTDISAIAAQPQFQRYTVKVMNNQYRFSVELDKEYGCFIEPLRS